MPLLQERKLEPYQSQLLYITNRVSLLGYACDQMSTLLNPRETDLNPEIADMDFWETINTIRAENEDVTEEAKKVDKENSGM